MYLVDKKEFGQKLNTSLAEISRCWELRTVRKQVPKFDVLLRMVS